jgi:uncharacterized protein YndB with AHSA1/START domain
MTARGGLRAEVARRRSRLMGVVLASALAQAAAVAAERALDKSIHVPASPAQVWQAWTTADGVRTWLAPDAVVDARVDGPFRIFFNPLAPVGQRGADDMRFLALQPHRMLSFDWNAPTDWPVVRAQRTMVIVRLEAVEGGTRVTLHQVGWGEGDDWDAVYRFFDRGWEQVLSRLQERFLDGPIRWASR